MFYLANILQPLLDVNEAILKFWHNSLGFSWGASIIGLTLVIRLAILPLNFKQIRSMQQMQRLQPELKRIQERYKEDKKRQQEEMMRFYKEHNFNPFGSCLPIVFQFPFFISLYQLQRTTSFKHQVCPPTGHCPPGGGAAHFLFIPNILKPTTGGVLVALIVIYIATQLASSLVTATNIQDKNQRRLMLFLPFVFVVIIIRFQAGLLIYWITTNIFTIFQQLGVKRFFPPPEPLPAGAAAAIGSGGGKGQQQKAARSGPDGGDGAKGDGRAKRPGRAGGPEAGKAGTSNGSDGKGQKAPPPAPRKRKKRSGRRR